MSKGKTIIQIIVLFILTSCSSSRQTTKEITTKTGLKYTIIKTGKGKTAKAGQEVTIYESMGYLSGKLFYAIEKPAPPIKFTLGTNQVIAGVDEAVTGMKAGEVRRLIVPPSLSKRTEYPDYLSPDSMLLYKVELVEIIKNK